MVREVYDEEFGPKKMTKKTIQASCRKNKLYLTPHLNDVLYLHYSGFNAIDSLEEYVGLKCLWLECNAISSISGLEHQPELRCLYLHNNLIKKIENLEHCKQLDTLNLSHNHIAKIENCGSDILPVLNTLNISHNYLKSIESIEGLRKCDFVSVLDISHNRIEDIAIVKVLGDMKGLRVLTMTGNPVVNEIPSYRKTLILECKSLTYLDSRPVFDKDRACAEAWKRGGFEEERKEHLRWKKEEQRKMRRSINATLRMRHRGDGEPELLKTSSDEEGEKECSNAEKEDFQEVEYQSNELAWKEMEDLFNQHTKALKPSLPSTEVNAKQIFEAYDMTKAMKENIKVPLVEEITAEEYEGLTAKNVLIEELPENSVQETTQDLQEEANDSNLTVLQNIPKAYESAMNDEKVTEGDDLQKIEPSEEIGQDDVESKQVVSLITEPQDNDRNEACTVLPPLETKPLAESVKPVETKPTSEARIASAEEDDTLNVVIQSKEISITMQPSCSKEYPQPSRGDVDQSGERKVSNASIDYVTGSDSNSDPTLVTDCESCVRRSSLAYSSRTDTSSDSEDMFDKIVPKKHRKLASTVRTDSSTSSSESSCDSDGGHGGHLGSKLDRQNTITEFIDEYKRFFHSVDVRDPRCVLKNRHKLVRPQTAKSQRTEPIVYEGVLKTMERTSNEAKIEEVRQEREADDRSLAKETVFERLLKGHAAVDMNIEKQMISIGGKEHNFHEYRLDVFRKDQEKLQTLIDRVTAQKERYNAHIDSIHDQLANIMEDYGQISEKLRKVDDMIQTIGEEVSHEEQEESEGAPSESPAPNIVEQIVENMIKERVVLEDDADYDGVEEEIPEEVSSDESVGNPPLVEDHPALTIEIEAGEPSMAPTRKPMSEEFGSDPVYRKFIDIQYEIDKLTEDEIFHALSEAARELQEEECETQLVQDAVDEYWNPDTDIDGFRKCLNLDAHPIIMRFKRFIEVQGTDTDDTDTDSHVRKLENAYERYERRLSNHLFDEYLVMSRKASIATTTGGESSAAELELIEIEGGSVLRASMSRRATAWDLEDPFEEEEENIVEERAEIAPDVEEKPEELEDDESKPETQLMFGAESKMEEHRRPDIGDH